MSYTPHQSHHCREPAYQDREAINFSSHQEEKEASWAFLAARFASGETLRIFSRAEKEVLFLFFVRRQRKERNSSFKFESLSYLFEFSFAYFESFSSIDSYSNFYCHQF